MKSNHIVDILCILIVFISINGINSIPINTQVNVISLSVDTLNGEHFFTPFDKNTLYYIQAQLDTSVLSSNFQVEFYNSSNVLFYTYTCVSTLTSATLNESISSNVFFQSSGALNSQPMTAVLISTVYNVDGNSTATVNYNSDYYQNMSFPSITPSSVLETFAYGTQSCYRKTLFYVNNPNYYQYFYVYATSYTYQPLRFLAITPTKSTILFSYTGPSAGSVSLADLTPITQPGLSFDTSCPTQPTLNFYSNQTQGIYYSSSVVIFTSSDNPIGYAKFVFGTTILPFVSFTLLNQNITAFAASITPNSNEYYFYTNDTSYKAGSFKNPSWSSGSTSISSSFSYLSNNNTYFILSQGESNFVFKQFYNNASFVFTLSSTESLENFQYAGLTKKYRVYPSILQYYVPLYPATSLSFTITGNYFDGRTQTFQVGTSNGPAMVSCSPSVSSINQIVPASLDSVSYLVSSYILCPVAQYQGQVSYTINSTVPLPVKSIPYEFPFRVYGYSTNITYQPLIPILPDTPSNVALKVNINSNLNYYTHTYNQTVDELDLVHPFATISVDYSSMIMGLLVDVLQVNVSDKIGINYQNCSVQYGNLQFNLTHANKIQGGDTGDQRYKFIFRTNPHFCNEDLVFTCEDLRGNNVRWSRNDLGSLSGQIFTQDVSKCGSSSTAFASQFKLFTIDYKYTSTADYVFSMILYNAGNVSQFSYNLILNPVSQTDPEIITIPLTSQDTFNNSNGYYSSVIHFNNTITNYYKLNLQIVYSGGISLTLTSDDLSYISSNSLTPFETSILIRKNYVGMPSYSPVVTSSGLYYVAAFANVTNLKNFTISWISATFHGKKSTTYPAPSAGVEIPILQIPAYSHIVWLDTVCDIYDNCFEYQISSYSMSVPMTSASVPAPLDMNSNTIHSLTASPSTIDVSSPNRKVLFSFSIQTTPTTWSLDTTIAPILYIVENQSMLKISTLLTRNSQTSTNSSNYYTASVEFPLNWGTRGIYQCYVWVQSTDGQLNGLKYDGTLLLTNQASVPVIWNTFVDMNNPTNIIITGSNLGYLETNPNYALTLTFGQSSSSLVPSYLNNTAIYAKLATGINLNGAKLFMGTKQVLLNIQSCMNDCSGRGTCVNGQCNCPSTYTGQDCSISTAYTCQNNCSNHGSCVMMMCNCDTGFIGPTCSIAVSENKVTMEMTPNTTAPVATIGSFSSPSDSSTTSSSSSNILSDDSANTKYKILLTRIQEYDYANVLVKDFSLEKEWNLVSSTSNSYVYNMTLEGYSYITVQMNLTGNNDVDFDFANTTFTVPSHSIKYFIRIDNYTFDSTLNHLTFTWENSYTSPNPCITNSQQITYGGADLNDVHYVMVPANQLQLYGRFSNLIVSDDRILMTANRAIISNNMVLVQFDVSYFSNYLEIDPDFSVLLNFNNDISTTVKDQCGNTIDNSSKGLPKYALIVIIVVAAFVGVLLIIGFTTLLYKKNFAFRMKVLTIKERISSKSENSFRLTKR